MPQIFPAAEFTFADALLTAMRDAQRERLQQEEVNIQRGLATEQVATSRHTRDLQTREEKRAAERHEPEMEGLRLGNAATRVQTDAATYALGELRETRPLRDRLLTANVTLGEFQAEDAPVQAAHGRRVDLGQLANQRRSADAAFAGVGAEYARIDLARDQFEEDQRRYDDPWAQIARMTSAAGPGGPHAPLASNAPRWEFDAAALPKIGPFEEMFSGGPFGLLGNRTDNRLGAAYREQLSGLESSLSRGGVSGADIPWLYQQARATAENIRNNPDFDDNSPNAGLKRELLQELDRVVGRYLSSGGVDLATILPELYPE